MTTRYAAIASVLYFSFWLFACREIPKHKDPLNEKLNPQSQLDKLRKTLAAVDEGKYKEQQIGALSLRGYGFHYELSIGHGFHTIVISRKFGGNIVSFRPDGSQASVVDTDEITSVQLIDIDNDEYADLATDEILDSGTGILDKQYRIYRVAPKAISRIWQGESYHRDVPWDADSDKMTSGEQRIGFLHFENNAFAHILINEVKGTCTESDYTLDDKGDLKITKTSCLNRQFRQF